MNNNKMPDSFGKPSADWTSRIQCAGSLLKRPFGHQSNKWSRRFFVLRDGFLLYYDDRERKEFEKRPFFNTHPKGMIPLGECDFRAVQEAGHPFSFHIKSNELNGMLLLAAESEYDRQKWMECLEKSRQVTWKNTQLGEEMIRQLQSQGIQIAREKQDYYDRLQAEVLALSEEKEKSEVLERLNQELEKEKEKLETFTEEIRDEYERTKQELDETMQAMHQLENDSSELQTTIQKQQVTLQALDEDRKKIVQKMQKEAEVAASLTKQKKSLSDTTEELKNKLSEIENETKTLLKQKAESEQRLKEIEVKTKELEEEKTEFMEHAQDLQATIKDLVVQKELTEKELKDEIKARISAEERLQDAEKSLSRLEVAVKHESSKMEEEIKEEMTVNVAKLRRFFEDLATEAKLASAKPIIIQNAVCARKSLARRAKTLKYQNKKRATMSRNQTFYDSRPISEEVTVRQTLPGTAKEGKSSRRAVTMVVRSTRSTDTDPAVDQGIADF